MNESGLVAVHMAANSTAIEAAATEIAAAVSSAPAPVAAEKPTTIADLSAAFPELCAELIAQGATTERTRILAIEAHALPGHEQLIASMKADPTVSADAAAGRILAAEKGLRSSQLQSLQDVEKLTGNVRAAAAPAPSIAAEVAANPEGWAAEYATSPALQAEFPNADTYVAFKKADNAGRVRVLKKSA